MPRPSPREFRFTIAQGMGAVVACSLVCRWPLAFAILGPGLLALALGWAWERRPPTLIETLVVVSITGVLAGLLMPAQMSNCGPRGPRPAVAAPLGPSIGPSAAPVLPVAPSLGDVPVEIE